MVKIALMPEEQARADIEAEQRRLRAEIDIQERRNDKRRAYLEQVQRVIATHELLIANLRARLAALD